MPLVYPRALSSTVVAPQYTYTREPYIPFGVLYDHTSNQIANSGLVHSAQMFLPMATPQIDPQLQIPLVPMSHYSFAHGVTFQYQQPPQAQILKSQQNVPCNHQWQRQTKGYDRKHPQRDQIPMTYAQLLPYLVQQGLIVPKEIPPATFPYVAEHNPNASCACHVGHIGHSTENYWPLKTTIQELMDQKILFFFGEGPNVMIEEGECSH